jgi:endoglucanase
MAIRHTSRPLGAGLKACTTSGARALLRHAPVSGAFVVAVLAAAAQTNGPTAAIKVDQAGYVPARPKIALVVSDSTPRAFMVRRAKDGEVVFRGELTQPAADAESGDRVQAADFSALRQRGRFHLDVPGVGRSWTFAIEPDAYARPFYLAMRSFYGQRCGTDVDLGREFPGYSYKACHRRGAFHPSSGRSGEATSARGWHDAGDYGRYIVNSGITTGTLLWAWEVFADRLRGVSLDIPESRDRTPDMLDEIRWNLGWMLTMQDADGGVWHKQTSERFAPFVLPHADTLISYIVGTGAEPYKSSCATADFAAVMAIAGRVYRPFDAKYAQEATAAARRAWTWLERHPNVLFRNPDGVATGAYGDKDCGDERLWAAAELARTTGEAAYERYFSDHYRDGLPTIRAVGPPSWANVGALGLWTYALGRGPNSAAVSDIVERSSRAADEIVLRVSAHPYRIPLVSTDYVWGSNGVAANYGMQLLVADRLKADQRYVDTAAETLHYLLGRNPFSLSWLTGVGDNPFRHPHHRPSGADANREPWPGLLSGGPNRRPQDPAMKQMPAFPPAKGYLDDQESFASNENAINWNAALVFVLAGVMQP